MKADIAGGGPTTGPIYHSNIRNGYVVAEKVLKGELITGDEGVEEKTSFGCWRPPTRLE